MALSKPIKINFELYHVILLKVACSWKPYLGKCLFFFVDFSAASPLQGTLQQKQCCVIDKLNTKPSSLAGFTTKQFI